MFQSISELQGRRVALFGLSGNPPTGNSGHRGIVNFLVTSGLFDEIWVIPVFQHMYSSKKLMAPYEDRVEMCKISMEDVTQSTCKVRVTMIEKYAAEYYEVKESKEYRVGTVDVIDYINEQCPGLDLSLVLGTDTFRDLMGRKWKNSDRILNLVASLHVIERRGVEEDGTGREGTADADADYAGTARVVHHRVSWLADVSSSLVRAISATSGVDLPDIATTASSDTTPAEPLTQPAPALEDLLDARVLAYIRARKLYASAAAGLEKLAAAHKVVGPPSEASRTVPAGTTTPATAPPRPTCGRPSRKPVA